MINQEKAPVGVDERGAVPLRVTSPQDLPPLAKYVAAEATPRPLRKIASQALERFLKSVYESPEPSAIIFVRRKESYVRPILDVFVIWSSPIRLTADAEDMRDLTTEHAKLARSLDPALDTFLKIVDPRQYPSPKAVTERLVTERDTLGAARVLAAACLER